MADTAPGLTGAEVLASRAEHGANVLTPPPRTPWWKLYFEKFNDPVIRILMIAAGVAIGVGVLDGKVAEGIGILAAIFLATFLAYWNEARAAREFDILNTTSDDVTVKVVRDGGYTPIPKRDVVVRDRVFIEVGEEVPADGVLSEAVGLLVNESKLTGEAVPVDKAAGAKLLRGTTIVDGYGLFTVHAVGDRTEIGRTLRESIEETHDLTPLNRQLARLSKIIGVVGFGVAAIAFAALFLRGLSAGTIQLLPGEVLFLAILGISSAVILLKIWLPIVCDAFDIGGWKIEPPAWLEEHSWTRFVVLGGVLFIVLSGLAVLADLIPRSPEDWLGRSDMQQLLRNFMIAVTIIVVAVPEGLAMSVTLSLAYSMRKMTASNTLVRRMAACETIGATTIICSDKTGTLTMNEMRLFEARFHDAATATLPNEPALRHLVIEAIAANTTAHLNREPGQPARPVGNPTEGALLLWLHDNGVDYLAARNAFRIARQWIFSTDRKFMATLGDILHVKGAPEIVLARCTTIATIDGERTMTAADRDAIAASLVQYQSRGMRTLALAYRRASLTGTEIDTLAEGLTWLGLVAIADPIRPAVPAAIALCKVAGVQVKIVTGDNAETAAEIARQIGLGSEHVPVTGPEFAAMDDATASATAASLTILARARPSDKLRLVRLLKAPGEVVAVTGDGVNDGPALNFADVGLAMGRSGTAVAREASDIILLDDSFPSILNAVRWGRALYENIQRFILFQLTINVVALGLAVLGPFLGYELPLTVMQMLWVNLIMDTFAALALATEPPHEGVLSRPPRSPRAFIVTRRMAREIFSVGAFFLAIVVGLIVYGMQTGQLPEHDEPSRFGTILFNVFVMLQFWNLFNAKGFGRGGSVIPRLGNNPSFLIIAAAILIGQIFLVQFGGAVFRTVPLNLMDWLIIIAGTSLVLVFGEVLRLRKPVAR